MIHDLLVGHTALNRVVPNAEGQFDLDEDGLLGIDFCQPVGEEAIVGEDGCIYGMEAGR